VSSWCRKPETGLDPTKPFESCAIAVGQQFVRGWLAGYVKDERTGHALKIGKDKQSETSAVALAKSSRALAGSPGCLFVPVESAWPVSSWP